MKLVSETAISLSVGAEEQAQRWDRKQRDWRENGLCGANSKDRPTPAKNAW